MDWAGETWSSSHARCLHTLLSTAGHVAPSARGVGDRGGAHEPGGVGDVPCPALRSQLGAQVVVERSRLGVTGGSEGFDVRRLALGTVRWRRGPAGR